MRKSETANAIGALAFLLATGAFLLGALDGSKAASKPDIPTVTAENTPSKMYLADYSQGISAQELRCYSAAVYHEARGESEQGQLAVVSVIVNRVRSAHWGTNACEVVTAKDQITGVQEHGLGVNDSEYRRIRGRVLKWLTWGYTNPIGGAMWYHTTEISPKWKYAYRKVAQIGNHVFYEPKLPNT